MINIRNISVEYEDRPLAVPTSGLRFGWILTGSNEVFQKSYRLRILSEDECVYDSETVYTEKCNNILIGTTLDEGKVYTVKLSIDSTDGQAYAETVFMTCIDKSFAGRWIAPKRHIEGRCVYFRKTFRSPKKVKRAMAYVCALGFGISYINGKRIDESYIDTPFTNYEKEVFYRAYDISDDIQENNAFCVHVGEGWYSQSRVWTIEGFKYGNICLAAHIQLEYEDGSSETIISDESWKTMYSPIILSNIYAGEIFDARLYDEAWNIAGTDEEDFKNAKLVKGPDGVLKGCIMPPVRVIDHIKPIAIKQLLGVDSGLWVYDMGENFAGIVKMRIPRSPVGAQYVLRFSETVDENGFPDYRSTGVYHTLVQQQDIYICSGKPNEEWIPSFTYHGFRYVEVTGFYGRDPYPELIEGLALSTDFAQTGSFSSDCKDLNDLHTVMMRTYRSNYHGFPEDCPVREKCGWLGDAQIVSDTAFMNYNVVSSYEKYMSDIATSKEVYGTWTMIAPGKRTCGEATPLWGCAQILIPYNMYKYFADKSILQKYYPLMQEWIEHELAISDKFIISDGLGDWCPPIGNKNKDRIPVPHSSTLMFYEICTKMKEISDILDLDGSRYTELAERIKCSFNSNFYDSEKCSYGYAASNAIAWLLGVCPFEDRDKLVDSTLELIKDGNYVMTTGIYGNKYLLPMLFISGNAEEAIRIMFGRTYYDFGTMLDDEGTSLWENLRMKSHAMTTLVESYNHPMHSGFAYMYYAYIAGIRPLKPGFSEFTVQPVLLNCVNDLDVSYSSIAGDIRVMYSKDDTKIEYNISVPVNTRCRLSLSDISGHLHESLVGSGNYHFIL